MVQVKICGICSAGDAQDAVDAGADLIGFHFCSSPRRIEPELARSIVDGLDRHPTIVGVFIDQPTDEVRQIADHVGLELLQLHGLEAPGFDAGRPLMKVLKVRGDDLPDASAWPERGVDLTPEPAIRAGTAWPLLSYSGNIRSSVSEAGSDSYEGV